MFRQSHGGNVSSLKTFFMKKIFIPILVLPIFAAFGCSSMNVGGDSPWAPPEKQKSAKERWEEREKTEREREEANRKTAENIAAVAAVTSAAAAESSQPVVVAAESRDAAEVVYADVGKRFVVAYRLGGIRPNLQKGDILALRAKDLTLRGVARLDIIDGETLGFTLIAGTVAVGDFTTVPGETLVREMAEKFLPGSVPESAPETKPAPAAKSASAPVAHAAPKVEEEAFAPENVPAPKNVPAEASEPEIDPELGEIPPEPSAAPADDAAGNSGAE